MPRIFSTLRGKKDQWIWSQSLCIRRSCWLIFLNSRRINAFCLTIEETFFTVRLRFCRLSPIGIFLFLRKTVFSWSNGRVKTQVSQRGRDETFCCRCKLNSRKWCIFLVAQIKAQKRTLDPETRQSDFFTLGYNSQSVELHLKLFSLITQSSFNILL